MRTVPPHAPKAGSTPASVTAVTTRHSSAVKRVRKNTYSLVYVACYKRHSAITARQILPPGGVGRGSLNGRPMLQFQPMSIRLRSLSRSFHGRVIFHCDELEASNAGLVALRGPNGCGKTTLLRILSTLTAPSTGEAWIDDHSVVSNPARVRAAIGYVPAGDGGMFRRLTGRENLLLFGSLCGLTRGETLRSIDSTCEFLSLKPALECRFSQASSGMRQALSLARALLRDPQVLLLDEPSRALDPDARAKLWKALKTLAQTKAVLFTTHYPDEWREATAVWEINDQALRCSTPS